MRVGVGFSEHEDTEQAGANAVHRALKDGGKKGAPDLILLFSTSYHNPQFLRSVVASTVGDAVPVIGGGAIGAITNERYGYGGEQIGVAAIWLEGAGFDLFAKGGIINNEMQVGERIGLRMAERGVKPETPAMLFYDAINRSHSDEVLLNLATPLLQGIEKGLGFLPKNLVGAGLQADFDSSPSMQWVANETAAHNAILLTFSRSIHIDSTIMHGCRPAGEYYTVTKAEGQTILEVNGQPAIPFIESQLHPALPADAFPFFMIFGINRDVEGSPYNEENYANRLCLGIDRDRNGIIMFESDMLEGTRFQIMYRSLDLEYIPPKINSLFSRVEAEGRRPVFAFYIDCAGRAARYSTEPEDAVVVQKSVGDRVPLLGIYSGVEISPIKGIPRTLDWTGVFCLFSDTGVG